MTEQTTLLVLVTAPDAERGAALGRTLVEERLAACVNILPGLRSIYHWQGAVEEESEVLLLIKTSSDLLPQLTERVKELHPYEVPEVLALPIAGGSSDYLHWLHGELRTAPGG